MQPTILIWLRRNLRLHDNAVLRQAAVYGLPLAAVWAADGAANVRQAAFWRQAACETAQGLAAQGVPCFEAENAEAVAALAVRLNAVRVLADEAYAPEERAADNRIWRLLDAHGIAFERINDRAVFAKAELMGAHGRPHTDFAAYRTAWLHAFAAQQSQTAHTERTALCPLPQSAWPPQPLLGAESGREAGQGEQAAVRQWQHFAAEAAAYPLLKDFPARKGTSRLSAYLAAGCLSPRVLAREAAERGWLVWLDTLIRRDFYVQTAFHFGSRHVQTAPQNADALWLARWQQGQTGYPLLDAAMRCLRDTGWLHPRLRLVAAEFWCGTLHQPWQSGAAWFAECLADADEALNVGNWLEAGRSGRRPNWLLLGQQLDPDAAFVRRHLPELAHLPKEIIHTPWLAGADIERHGYPPPMAVGQSV